MNLCTRPFRFFGEPMVGAGEAINHDILLEKSFDNTGENEYRIRCFQCIAKLNLKSLLGYYNL
jgi:hypothetical protein